MQTDIARSENSSSLLDLFDLPHNLKLEGIREDLKNGGVLQPHIHDEGLLAYATSGVLVVGSEEGYWVVPPTRALWVPPGARHWSRTSRNVNIRSVLLRAANNAGLPSRSCVIAVSALMREVINALAHIECDAGITPRDLALATLLVHELNEVPILPLHLPSLRDTRLAAIERHILDRPAAPGTLAAWAEKLNLDQRTVHRLFVKATGMSFTRWLQQAQLLIAMEWLASGQKIIDVAAGLGYRSQSAFTVMFKRNLGVPPGEFFCDFVKR